MLKFDFSNKNYMAIQDQNDSMRFSIAVKDGDKLIINSSDLDKEKLELLSKEIVSFLERK